MFKKLMQTVGLPYLKFYCFFFFSGDIKKKSSENDQLVGHFQSFFIFYFFNRQTSLPIGDPQ